MATPSMNTLTVRRVDLLEQLEERYAYMSQEKAKYEKAVEKFHTLTEKYDKDIQKWEERIPTLLEGMVRGSDIDYSHNTERYGRYQWNRETWNASISISLNRDEVTQLIGPEPTRPEAPDTPEFLRQRRLGRSYSSPLSPSLYEAVYQAIAILSISNDDDVKAQMFNDVLLAL